MGSGIILLVNGPNLNMLGIREPEKYGNKKLQDIVDAVEKYAVNLGYKIKSFQSNHEGELIDFIQKEGITASGMVINAGAFTHTSIALRDAILSIKLPFTEIHISNIFCREDYRRHSYLSDIAAGLITGFGENSYYLGIRAMIDFIQNNR